jgi:hypothetical protein
MYEDLKKGDFVELLKSGCFNVNRGRIGKVTTLTKVQIIVTFFMGKDFKLPQSHSSCDNPPKFRKIPKDVVVAYFVAQEL